MVSLDKICCLPIGLLICNLITSNSGQSFETNVITKNIKTVTWCTVNKEEQKKCRNFANAVERDEIKVLKEIVQIECLEMTNKIDCMEMLDLGKATMTTLDAGQVFAGGRYYSIIPLAQEVMAGGFSYYYAVAVVKKNTLPDVRSMRDLRGKEACFAGVETFAGWILPIYTLIKEGGMEVIDCNNHVKTATNFFGPSCAVNCLTDKYNPIGDNSDKLCQLCIGKIPGGRCTDQDPYAGYTGAFRCLLEAGEVAFLKHTTVVELLAGHEFGDVPKDQFELLCKDGTRKHLNEYFNCNWGRVPSDAIVISSAVPYDDRIKFQKYLLEFSKRYSPKNGTTVNPEYDQFGNRIDQFGNRQDQPEYDQFGNRRNRPDYTNRFKRQTFNNNYGNNENNQYGSSDQYGDDQYGRDRDNDQYGQPEKNEYGDYNGTNEYPTDGVPYETFRLFESTPKYGIRTNLLFQDAAVGFKLIPENLQTYKLFLEDAYNIILGLRDCAVETMTLCVTSDAEQRKCDKMRTALSIQLLKPALDCYKGHSQIHCMQAIRAGTADVTVLDASDVYTAGLNYDLIPFISEVYNLDEAEYYVVAVAKESDPSTELTYLRTKNTCHGGINTAAGWVYPLAFLISNSWIRPYGCNSIRAAAEYFTKSCVPGALSTEYNTGVPYDNMCDLCHGASYRYCRRDASEDYYGHTGAFRCLVEGGGDVAFVKHTTVTENTGGKKSEWWARDNLNDDFELLCPDGTRAEVEEYQKCNLGKVKANAIVARGGYGYNETHINAYINLFMYAQTFYGTKRTDEFNFAMFTSAAPYSDLIFQDATTQLRVIKPDKRYYSSYLGSDFMRARRIVDCHASASTHKVATFALSITSIMIVRSMIGVL